MLKALNAFGRALGALCGAVLSVAWILAVWVPAAGLTLSGVSVVVALLLAMFAVFAIIASLKGHAAVVVLLFLASFFPIGAYLMPVDHWLRWIGWLDLGLLLAAVLIWVTRRAMPASPPPAEEMPP
jgi:ABC-type glycerol-3-phosphate transport system permease component